MWYTFSSRVSCQEFLSELQEKFLFPIIHRLLSSCLIIMSCPVGFLKNSTGNMTQVEIEYMRKICEILKNRPIGDVAFYALCVCYTLLIITGVIGNGMVCAAVIRKPAMRTARNVYIINLAISDLLLCLFTMPFTLMELSTKYWPMGMFTFSLFLFTFFWWLLWWSATSCARLRKCSKIFKTPPQLLW